MFVTVHTNFKIVRSLKRIANTNHIAKMYAMHASENITHNWVIFSPTTG